MACYHKRLMIFYSQMINKEISAYMAKIGRTGGRKSKRSLASKNAKEMVRVREARKAFRDFHATCFWSSPPNYQVSKTDIDWVVDQLQRHGGQAGWERAERLCR